MYLRTKKCPACLIAAEKRGFIGDMAIVIFSLHSARCTAWDSFIAFWGVGSTFEVPVQPKVLCFNTY